MLNIDQQPQTFQANHKLCLYESQPQNKATERRKKKKNNNKKAEHTLQKTEQPIAYGKTDHNSLSDE